jgi:carbon storage regulator
MLVLTRRKGEVILIGNNIRLRVVGIGHCSVRLGIEAPRDIRVVREEVGQRTDAEHIAATDWGQAPMEQEEVPPTSTPSAF